MREEDRLKYRVSPRGAQRVLPRREGSSGRVPEKAEEAPIKNMTYDDYIDNKVNQVKLFEQDEGGSRFEQLNRAKESVAAWLKRVLSLVLSKGRVITPLIAQSYSSAMLWARKMIKVHGPLKVASAVSLLLLFSGGGLLLTVRNSDTSTKDGTGLVASPQDEASFPVLKSETIEQADSKITFDPSIGVASYEDVFKEQRVIVSQQPLSEEQAQDPHGFLDSLAEQLDATGNFGSDKGTVHYKADLEEGQTLIFIYKDLLIFLRTESSSIEINGWQQYIDRLQ